MDVPNFNNPLGPLRMFSIFNHLNTLGNFLFEENLLQEKDRSNQEEIINSLYDFVDQSNNRDKKLSLIQTLIAETDLYGSNKNETIDDSFVNLMFQHILSSLVFSNYVNVYGFIAEIVMHSENGTMNSLFQDMKYALENSSLKSHSVQRILRDIILPLFPLPMNTFTLEYVLLDSTNEIDFPFPLENDFSILSVDYIYAQAGLMYCRSGLINSDYIKSNYNQEKIYDGNNLTSSNILKQYIRIGQTMELLALSGKIDNTALKVFAFPALLHYVYKEKEKLITIDIENIIIDEHHWTEAYDQLFSYLKTTSEKIKAAIDNDQKYQYHIALSKYKNRTTLARENIQKYCSISKEHMEQELNGYKNNPGDFKCKKGNEYKLLPNINHIFNKQNEELQKKFSLFKKELIREAFEDILTQSMNQHIQISVTLGHTVFSVLEYLFSLTGMDYMVKGSITKEELELIKARKSSTVIYLEIYYSSNDTMVYYTMIDKDDTVKLSETFRYQNISYSSLFIEGELTLAHIIHLKHTYASFEDFSTSIAEDKGKEFRKNIDAAGYDETTKEWWTDLGLSLIPFYSCITGITHGDRLRAAISCPLDSLMVIPFAGEIVNVVSKLVTATTQALVNAAGTTLGESSIKLILEETLKIEGKELFKEVAVEVSNAVLTKETFKTLAIATLRLVDPGFELIFLLGRKGAELLERMAIAVEKKFSISLEFVRQTLNRINRVTTTLPKKIGSEFGRDMYVKSMDSTGLSGYGYKFLYLPGGKIAELRSIHGIQTKVHVVFDRVENNIEVYKKVDVQTGVRSKYDLYLVEDKLILKPEPLPSNIPVRKYNGVIYCNHIRYKRSPGTICSRSDRLEIKQRYELEAVEIGVKYGKISQKKISKELKKYVFPEGGYKEKEFVEAWMTNPALKKPSWAKYYRLKCPEILFDLRYKELLDDRYITEEEVKNRIEKVFSSSYNLNQEFLREQYINTYASLIVKFEDFCLLAILQGLSGGSRGFGGLSVLKQNSNKARRMKNALYRLAVRQYDEPIENFATKLYRGEAMSKRAAIKLFQSIVREEIEFQEITFTTTMKEIAEINADFMNGDIKVLYEIELEGPYLRSKLDIIVQQEMTQHVLFPGSRFEIQSIDYGRSKKYWTIKLKYIPTTMTQDLKRAMAKVEKLVDSGTRFYHDIDPHFLSKIKSTIFG